MVTTYLQNKQLYALVTNYLQTVRMVTIYLKT